MKILVLGGPGCGKTERLLDAVESSLEIGIPPERIAYVTFTNIAINEAKERARQKYNIQPDQTPYFRTLHSLCFRELGLHRNEVLGEEGLVEVAEFTGELFTGQSLEEGPATRMSTDALLTVEGYARVTRNTLRAAWEAHGGVLDWFRLKRFAEAYRNYRETTGYVDFTEMLERFVVEGHPVPVEVAIIDEAQDLSLLQWDVVNLAFGNTPNIWIGGDALQSIHRWAGAADDYFADLVVDRREILPLSYRISSAVRQVAASIAKEAGSTIPWRASGRHGAVEFVSSPEEANLSEGSWLLLARTRSQLQALAEAARSQGILYTLKGLSSVEPSHLRAIIGYERLRAGGAVDGSTATMVLQALGKKPLELDESGMYGAGDLYLNPQQLWHDALITIPLADREYYLACLRRGEKLTGQPRVRIDTIHGAKGAQAQNVLLLTDLTARVAAGFEIDPLAEHRVFYVGVTRASERLLICAPTGRYRYDFTFI